jgi:hypothetical protein
VVLVALLVGQAAAHWPSAEEVVAEVGGVEGRAAGVVEVTRDPTVARLLLVRVGAAWYTLAPERRRTLAERWRTQWREAVSEGLVGVVDATSARPVINYDARGQAHVETPAPP